jgi:hypothetical protein
VERLSDPELVAWLAASARTPGGSAVGYDATGWESAIWLLHAMYETDERPAGLTHDDVARIERAAGISDLPVPVEVFEELLPDAVAVGSALGRTEWPGPGWKRLRWSEVAARLNVDPLADGVPPSSDSFPYRSWPVTIEPPGEGSLDREQYLRLVDHLAAVSGDGFRAPCYAFYGACAVGEFDEVVVYAGELGELAALYDHRDVEGSPSNIWPDDRSWMVYTDWDLWGTKVSGDPSLTESLLADSELEAVSLDVRSTNA